MVVRWLLALIYSSEVALGALNLSLCETMDVLLQAKEWQCDTVVTALLASLKQKLKSADACTSLSFLKFASLHKDSSSDWDRLLCEAIDRVADTCAGELGGFHELPFRALKSVLVSDKLDTGDDEGRVLLCVVGWVQKYQERIQNLPDLLKCVRFPFLRLGSLISEEKSLMRFAHDHASELLQTLVSAAASVQVGAKRKSLEPIDGVQKRHCCGSIP